MKSDSVFRRNLIIVAALHVAFVGVLYLSGKFQRKAPVEKIMWIEGGSIGGGEPGESGAEPAEPEPAPTPEPEPMPLPPEPEPEAKPELIKPPSEIPLSTPEPATPKPATPKPITPKPQTPKPATPKPTTPKPATPKPATAKPATPKPKASPKPNADASPKATPSDKPKGTPGTAKSGAAGATPGAKSGGNGPGAGNGKGPGKTGSGTGASEHGWYFAMIRDRFMARWAQPTDIQRGGADVITLVKLRINADGTIASYKIITESGYPQMEESVLRAVEKVTQIDPLPAGLSTDGFLDVPLQFKLDQGQ